MQNGRGRIQGLPEFKRSTARAELSPAWQTNNDFWGPTCSISSKEPTTDKVTVCMSCIKLFLLVRPIWVETFAFKKLKVYEINYELANSFLPFLSSRTVIIQCSSASYFSLHSCTTNITKRQVIPQ